MTDEVLKAMDLYESKFHGLFSLMIFHGTDQEIINEINLCIERNAPYDPYEDPKVPEDAIF